MNFTRTFFASALLLAGALGFAADREVFHVAPPNFNSDGTSANVPAGSTRSFTTVGGYTMGRIRISGTFTRVNGNDWAQEAQIRLSGPGGRTLEFGFDGLPQGYTGSMTVSRTITIPGYGQPLPAGNWTISVFETYDDGGVGSVDKTWNSLDVTFTDETAAPPASTDLGVIGAPGDFFTSAVTAGGVRWYKFDILEGTNSSSNYFDIDTEGTTQFLGTGANNTYLALFNSVGALISGDDDDGSASLSQLSFGPSAGNRGTGGFTGVNYDGRDGDILAGTYYLAVSGSPATFGNEFTYSSSGAQSGNVQVNLRTNIAGSGANRTTLTGTFTLSDYLPSLAGEQIPWSIETLGGQQVAFGICTLDAAGHYSLSAPASVTGNARLRFSRPHFLSKSILVNFDGSTQNGVNVALRNGDVNLDNEVGLADFGIMSDAFQTIPSDPVWNANADLDKDNQVGLSDFGILSASFGEIGD